MASIMRMPEVLANATEAIISKWIVAEGEQFVIGQPIAEVETEKAVVEVIAEAAGSIGRYLAQSGKTIQVGEPIAVLLVAGEGAAEIEKALAYESISLPTTEATVEKAADPAQVHTQTSHEPAVLQRVFSSPLARKLARENGVDAATLHGTGPGGRIVKRDVEVAISSGATKSPVALSPEVPKKIVSADESLYTAIPHSRMRQAIARRLTESKSSVPHFYLSAPVIADDMLNLRKKLNEWSEKKISVTDLILKTVASTFDDVPAANVIWTTEEMRHFENVDISIAVATDKGLITPVVRGVDLMNLAQINATTTDLIERARIGRLKQNEIVGGSFSVTNLGMYGTDEFSAILNPPQSAILAVGAAKPKPIVLNGAVAIANVINFTLSVDHRAIDGALAAEWLAAFVKRFENPMWLVV